MHLGGECGDWLEKKAQEAVWDGRDGHVCIAVWVAQTYMYYQNSSKGKLKSCAFYCVWILSQKGKKIISTYWTLNYMLAEVIRACTDVYNLIWNTLENKLLNG